MISTIGLKIPDFFIFFPEFLSLAGVLKILDEKYHKFILKLICANSV